ncbi:hypothetical protein Micbo1qcDRAFT_165525, partial [Microdochium bolleyi]
MGPYCSWAVAGPTRLAAPRTPKMVRPRMAARLCWMWGVGFSNEGDVEERVTVVLKAREGCRQGGRECGVEKG